MTPPSPVPAGTERAIGYVLAMNYAESPNPKLRAKGWQIDWDAEVHPSWAAAFRECCKANGEDWRDEVAAEGLTPQLIREADYLPYALTPQLANPAAVVSSSPATPEGGRAVHDERCAKWPPHRHHGRLVETLDAPVVSAPSTRDVGEQR